jgi:hypothetical protein
MSDSADEWNESKRMKEGDPCCCMVVLSGPDSGTLHCDDCLKEFPTDKTGNEYHVWEIGEVAFGDGSLYHNFQWGPYEVFNGVYLCEECKNRYMKM